MSTVIRMTITATLAMIIIMTFRIPDGFLAAYFSILLARENLAATWGGARMIVFGFGAASLYTLFGTMLFRGYAITHFFWIVGSLFLAFFVIRTATNYSAAVPFGVLIAVALPVWDGSSSSEVQVENTLWPVLAIAVAAGATVAVEAVYRIFNRSDPFITSVDDMLLAVQQVAESIANLHAPPKSIRDRVLQYRMVGTGRLRTMLQRQGVDPTKRAQRTALIALADRLIRLAAILAHTPTQPAADDAIRLRAFAEKLGTIRAELRDPGFNSASPPVIEGQPSFSFPMLQEMERTVALIPQVFRPGFLDPSRNAPRRDWWQVVFVPDAFQNPDYLRFAFAGCVAGSLCYFLYNALDWRGISTSVITCVVTGLTTVGTSVQMQFLRFAGFVVGGLILGISAQILILPGIDSIFGFALFFAAVTAFAAWFATSSPRLSYFGLQIAIAFYFVHVQDFQIQTDLTVARDKVIGVLLGILAMGFIFDRFGTKSDREQLQKMLVGNVRLLAQLAGCAVKYDRVTGVSGVSRLRVQINDNFANLTSQMDSVQFEFEFLRRRDEDVAEWDRIQRSQPALRSIYLLELTLLSHREQREIASELTQQQNLALDSFLNGYSDQLKHIAAWIAHEDDTPGRINDDSIGPLMQTFKSYTSPDSRAIVDICQKMVSSLVILRNECKLAF